MATKAKQQQQANKIVELRALADSPAEQTAYALKLLETERNYLTVEAALQVLAENPVPEVRALLLNLYKYYEEDVTKRDQGATMRAFILKVLRDTVRKDDVPLLERAASSIEFMPPGRFDEIAMGLRSAALITLNEIDSALAAYHAVRLLNDEHTSKMSGEPAVTAAQVLATQRNYLPLYQYITQPGEKISEVLAECIRNSVDLPLSLLEKLVAEYGRSNGDAVLIGLFDLILVHRANANFEEFLTNFLTTTRNYEVYRYLVLAILTSGQKALITKLVEVANGESDPRRVPILLEVLAVTGQHDPQIKALLKKLRA